MNIKSASEKTGLPTKTIRYYDDIGLIAAERQANGYRDYDLPALQKLEFVKRLRQTGFSIDECRQLLTLWGDANRASADVKALAEKRLQEIDQRLADLGQLRDNLRELVDLCPGDSRPDCPILDDFSRTETLEK